MISQNTLYFEEYVSDMIPLERTLPDARGEWCRGEYGDTERFNGERTSVIICFHNEVQYRDRRQDVAPEIERN